MELTFTLPVVASITGWLVNPIAPICTLSVATGAVPRLQFEPTAQTLLVVPTQLFVFPQDNVTTKLLLPKALNAVTVYGVAAKVTFGVPAMAPVLVSKVRWVCKIGTIA